MWLVVVAKVMTTRTAKNPENQAASMPGNTLTSRDVTIPLSP